MRHRLITPALAAAFLAAAAPAQAADCYADYKAKRDNPLKLHYGVIQLQGDCSKQAAAGEVAGRISADGWTLLNVLSVFGPEGLNQRKADAGPFYLRF
jgi:hypothetical protein